MPACWPCSLPALTGAPASWRGLSLSVIAALVGDHGAARTWEPKVSVAVNELIDAGKITRLRGGSGRASAIYKLGGTKKVPPNPPAEASGIEAITWMIARRNYDGLGAIPKVAISLARVKCLERPL